MDSEQLKLAKDFTAMLAKMVDNGDYEVKFSFRKGLNPLSIGDHVKCGGIIVSKITDSTVFGFMPFEVSIDEVKISATGGGRPKNMAYIPMQSQESHNK